MFDWLKKLVVPIEETKPILPPEQALEELRALVTDVVLEEVYEALDLAAETVRPEIESWVRDGNLGEYPMHASVVWLAYQDGNRGEQLAPDLRDHLDAAIHWAFQFEINNVLLGAALGALDSLSEKDRNDSAIRYFEALADVTVRRYWLMLKVRTPELLKLVGESLADYDPEQRKKMAGAFRQFSPEDADLVFEYLDVDGPGAEMFVEALPVLNDPRSEPKLRTLADSEHANVREAARRVLG